MKKRREQRFLHPEVLMNHVSFFRAKAHSIFIPVLLSFTVLLTASCGKNSNKNLKIPGVQGPTVALIGKTIRITFVFEQVQVDQGFTYPIPKYPNSFVELGPDFTSSGTIMSFNMALEDVIGGEVKDLDPQYLPGGRPLPGVPSGSLPAVAFTIPSFHGISVYLGPRLFGVFVPHEFSLQGQIITTRYYISSKKMGLLSVVGKDVNGENSGVLLMLDMNSSTKNSLKRLM